MEVSAIRVSTSERRWEALYEQEFPRIYRAVAAVLADSDAALDAMQEAFVEGLRHPPASDANLAGWIYRVALRKGRRGLVRRFISLDRLLDTSREPEANNVLDGAADRELIRELLASVSQRQRTILVARYYLGMRQDEIARVLGVQRGTIAATITQALARIREAVR